MTFFSQVAHLALTNLPDRLVNSIRSIIPISIKQSLSKQLMEDVVLNAERTHISVKDGRKFNIIKDGHFLRIIYENSYEPKLSAIATKLIQKNDITVDVGANFGWYTTLFCSLSQGGKVISYEPVPYSYKILEDNIDLNNMKSLIEVRKVGVGNKKGQFLMETNIGGSLAHVIERKSESSIEVPVVTLNDELAEFKNRISYMKFDIEGSEHLALKGCNEILNVTHQPIIQIELNEDALVRTGSSREEVIALLKNIGYSFYEVDNKKTGYLQKSYNEKCSDIFCFGRGKYSERLKSLLLT